MSIARFCLVATIAIICLPWSAHAAGLKVIANRSVGSDSISAEKWKNFFLEDSNSLKDGSHVEPVLARGGPAHEAFLKEFLGKSDSVLQAYYRSLVFTGKASMPKTLTSDADIVAYVAKTKGAIGYVSSDTSTAGVKTLQVR